MDRSLNNGPDDRTQNKRLPGVLFPHSVHSTGYLACSPGHRPAYSLRRPDSPLLEAGVPAGENPAVRGWFAVPPFAYVLSGSPPYPVDTNLQVPFIAVGLSHILPMPPPISYHCRLHVLSYLLQPASPPFFALQRHCSLVWYSSCPPLQLPG